MNYPSILLGNYLNCVTRPILYTRILYTTVLMKTYKRLETEGKTMATIGGELTPMSVGQAWWGYEASARPGSASLSSVCTKLSQFTSICPALLPRPDSDQQKLVRLQTQ